MAIDKTTLTGVTAAAVSTASVSATAGLPVERSNFLRLIASNPNYFGNLRGSQFKPVLPQAGNSTFEELGAPGLNPALNRVDVVVYVNKTSGYGGGLCTAGSREYVRFYLSYDHGATWKDEGVSSFAVYDVAESFTEGKRLEYALSKSVNPPRKYCHQENVILVRAILSWNVIPPADAPDYVPVWGQTQTSRVHPAAKPYFILADLLELLKVKAGTSLSKLVDPQFLIPASKKPLNLQELARLYDGQVPAKRFAHREIYKTVNPAKTGLPHLTLQQADFGGIAKEGVLAGLDIDFTTIFQVSGDGDVSFEELRDVGYHPDQSALIGVIEVKKPSGYSGNLCSAGSHEYVAFWADVDANGSYETYLGTAAVNVNDILSPDGGSLFYSVVLPVDLERFRRPCAQGPRVIRIRAILSWNVQPPADNPGFVPVWGNREETRILLNPGRTQAGLFPVLSGVGDMPINTIASDGKATGTGNLTGFVASDSPFGGVVNITGKIAGGTPGVKYRVVKKPAGAPDSAYQPIRNEPLRLTLVTLIGGSITVDNNFTVAPDAEGYYAYQDYSGDHFVDGNLLVRWYTTEAEHLQKFDLRVEMKDGVNVINGDTVSVLIDNKGPDVSLALDLGVGGVCADFKQGDLISGTFKAADSHFYTYAFTVRPEIPAHNPFITTAPVSRVSVAYGGAVTDPGVNAGTYSFSTAGMDPCGYSLTLGVYSRTNLNSGTARPYDEKSVGFCVRKPAA